MFEHKDELVKGENGSRKFEAAKEKASDLLDQGGMR
jgi:hypothetical protein